MTWPIFNYLEVQTQTKCLVFEIDVQKLFTVGAWGFIDEGTSLKVFLFGERGS